MPRSSPDPFPWPLIQPPGPDGQEGSSGAREQPGWGEARPVRGALAAAAIVALLLGTLSLGTLALGTSAGAGPAGAEIGDFGFAPDEIAITVGEQVVWTNVGEAGHSVTADDRRTERLDSGRIERGATFSHTFETPGTVAYRCEIHPPMRGVVRVAPRATATAPTETTTTTFPSPTTATVPVPTSPPPVTAAGDTSTSTGPASAPTATAGRGTPSPDPPAAGPSPTSPSYPAPPAPPPPRASGTPEPLRGESKGGDSGATGEISTGATEETGRQPAERTVGRSSGPAGFLGSALMAGGVLWFLWQLRPRRR